MKCNAPQARPTALIAPAEVPVEVREDRRFICSHDRFRRWAEGKRSLTMEFFYREMRRETGLLMDGDQPEGGRWNYDAENRKKLAKGVTPPDRLRIPPNAVAREAMADVERLFGDHFGSLDGFGWATTAEEAEASLKHFLKDVLPSFGDWQDAMAENQPWMWHGLISTSINLKSPRSQLLPRPWWRMRTSMPPSTSIWINWRRCRRRWLPLRLSLTLKTFRWKTT
mgnify:CR=1 FL=1